MRKLDIENVYVHIFLLCLAKITFKTCGALRECITSLQLNGSIILVYCISCGNPLCLCFLYFTAGLSFKDGSGKLVIGLKPIHSGSKWKANLKVQENMAIRDHAAGVTGRTDGRTSVVIECVRLLRCLRASRIVLKGL